MSKEDNFTDEAEDEVYSNTSEEIITCLVMEKQRLAEEEMNIEEVNIEENEMTKRRFEKASEGNDTHVLEDDLKQHEGNREKKLRLIVRMLQRCGVLGCEVLS